MRRFKRDAGSRMRFDERIKLPQRFQQFDERTDSHLFKKARKGNIEAINTLIEKNYGLIIASINDCVSQKPGDKLNQEDYFQYGIEGLRKAILRFDTTRGIKFSTYATFWIRQALFRAFYTNYSDFHFPIHLFKRKTQLREAKKSGHSTVDASEIVNIDKQLLRAIITADPRSKSVYLNQNYQEESEPALMIEKIGDTSCVQEIENDLMRDELLMAIKKILTEKEYEVISRRFGLGSTIDSKRGQIETLDVIGTYMNLSRERIRQIEVLAIKKLRSDKRFVGFREYLKE